MTLVRTPNEAALDRAGAALIYALEQAGWRLINVEIDTHRETARIEIKGFDGRLLTLDARDGRASITREVEERWMERPAKQRRGFPVARYRYHLLGRTRYPGFRSAMRSLSHYLADNAPRATLPREVSRRLLGPLCDGWGEREVSP